MAGVSAGQLGGYLLEEVVAWMLQSSGYRLLVASDQDPDELVDGANGLRVRGRGAEHQADVLGELAYVPPFSLPLRMFIEAKCYKTERIGLGVVRNAHGVIDDVNQNWSMGNTGGPPRQRYQYLYALFSTSGFTLDAQRYAQAHQIVLVDLSEPSFFDLRTRLKTVSGLLIEAAGRDGHSTIPLHAVRAQLRQGLGTALPSASSPPYDTLRPDGNLVNTVQAFSSYITEEWRSRLLLGFPSARQILVLRTPDADTTAAVLSQHATHRIHLRRLEADDHTAQWTADFGTDAARLQLQFSLPSQIESWLTEVPDQYRARHSMFKTDFLSNIAVIYTYEGETRVTRLTYVAPEIGNEQDVVVD
ncbi:MAG TPA: restriction endonuclease [Vicinamibacterales bacterium]